jgi:DNA-directed RNA polymerase specialized sigma24 family protein
VAYRKTGSASEADAAVQESCLRVSRAGTSGVENLHQNGADNELLSQLEVRILG